MSQNTLSYLSYHLDSTSNAITTNSAHNATIWRSKHWYLGHLVGFWIESTNLWESVPILTASNHKSLKLLRTQSKQFISADNLSGDGSRASLACIPTSPLWSLVIHAPPVRCLSFLQFVWKLHFTIPEAGATHFLGTPRSFDIKLNLKRVLMIYSFETLKNDHIHLSTDFNTHNF